jgi:protease PrsW
MGWTVLAVFFAGIWIYALYREDFRNPEPLWMILLATTAGFGAAVAADRVEGWVAPGPTLMEGSLAARAALAFFVAGPVEEGLKLVGVLLLVRPWSHFDEPMDGILYGAAAGAGFALAENLAFMQLEPEAALVRGPIGTGAHVLFSTLWGGALGHAGHLKGFHRKAALTAAGLAAAALAHGAFDLIAFSSGKEITLGQARAGTILLATVCTLVLRWRLRAAVAEKPFRPRSSTNPVGPAK